MTNGFTEELNTMDIIVNIEAALFNLAHMPAFTTRAPAWEFAPNIIETEDSNADTTTEGDSTDALSSDNLDTFSSSDITDASSDEEKIGRAHV